VNATAELSPFRAGFVFLKCLGRVGPVGECACRVRPARATARHAHRFDHFSAKRAFMDHHENSRLIARQRTAPPLNVGVESLVGEDTASIDTAGVCVSIVERDRTRATLIARRVFLTHFDRIGPIQAAMRACKTHFPARSRPQSSIR